VGEQHVASLTHGVERAVTRAVAQVLPDRAGDDPLVRPSDHADLQSNAALAVAKAARMAPVSLAGAVAGALREDSSGTIARVDVSGPGFLNITLEDAALWGQVAARSIDERLGIGTPETGRRTVIDYSAPNIAKEMHVGHLRTTILGDSLARVLGFLGGEVIRQNHVGDWGTQFGMLIQYLEEHPDARWHQVDLDADPAAGTDAVSALDGLYRAARAVFDADPDFADRARRRVVALQAGDPATVAAWTAIVAESEAAFGRLYRRLGVLLTPADYAGESTYNDQLADVAAELDRTGVAKVSNGALCVFDDAFSGPDGEPTPLLVRKSDGGYGYDTTDLATLRHRVRELKADRLLYVVDARQSLHFAQIFAAARAAGWLTDAVEAVHVAFGTVLGPDGRPFRTRSGGTVRLAELLDAAVAKAGTVVAEKNPDMPAAELDRIAGQAGIGAVKYADLSTSRTKDYAFDIDRMVSLTGNTGVYLQYAHARIRSLLRRAATQGLEPSPAGIDTTVGPVAAERRLILALDRYADVLADVAATFEPHRLCGYLYALARTYTDFYETCPVLSAETEAQRGNRLALSLLTAETLRRGLDLLGIAAPDRL
jgi:arginyl-tRNA synthetase